MESTHGQKWLVILFFSAISSLFLYFILAIAMDRTDKSYYARLERARVGPGSYHQGEKIQLVKDQAVTVQKIKMIYRGRSSGGLLIDLVFLDLDPHYVYSRRIPLQTAKHGFFISNRQFLVTSVNDNRLRLVTGPLKK